MTRMFLEDDDNLSDDAFNDASPQDETEKTESLEEIDEDEEPERLDDFDEDDDFDENWDADFEPPDKGWYAETLEIKKAARAADGPDFADADEEEDEEGK